jgi:hypothetical protein
MTHDTPLESQTPEPPPAATPAPARPVERLFPFVLRARVLLIGRQTLRHSKSKLHFVLITRDISEASRAEIVADFAHYPVVQHFVAEDLEKHFGIRGAKVVGFAKSGLAKSIYAELKEHRINQPVANAVPAEPAAAAPAARVVEPKPRPPRPAAATARPARFGKRPDSGPPRQWKPRPPGFKARDPRPYRQQGTSR